MSVTPVLRLNSLANAQPMLSAARYQQSLALLTRAHPRGTHCEGSPLSRSVSFLSHGYAKPVSNEQPDCWSEPRPVLVAARQESRWAKASAGAERPESATSTLRGTRRLGAMSGRLLRWWPGKWRCSWPDEARCWSLLGARLAPS